MYAETAPCNVDHPPRRPSKRGARIRNLWPWVAKSECGVETRMKIRSLREHYIVRATEIGFWTHARKRPRVAVARTRVRPWRSPNLPHQPVVRAERPPIVMVIIAERRAALAWTTGSERHLLEGRRRGSPSS